MLYIYNERRKKGLKSNKDWRKELDRVNRKRVEFVKKIGGELLNQSLKDNSGVENQKSILDKVLTIKKINDKFIS